MIFSFELALLMLALLGFGVWGIYSGIKQNQRQIHNSVKPQELSALAQPFKNYMGEAVSIHKDVAIQASNAPKAIKHELMTLAQRIDNLIKRAMPRAKHGTSLAEYLLRLEPDEAQYQTTLESKEQVEQDLAEFVDNLKLLRGKVYQVLTDATSLQKDNYLSKDLDDALIEISALESAFSELNNELKL